MKSLKTTFLKCTVLEFEIICIESEDKTAHDPHLGTIYMVFVDEVIIHGAGVIHGTLTSNINS